MIIKKRFAVLLLGIASMGLSGCSLTDGNSEYGCKGMPNAVTCMNVRDVYALTDGDDYQQRVDETSQQQLDGKPVDVKRLAASGNAGGARTSAGARYVPVPATAANPQPIRTQSEVMRVLVDPYESSDGDLNVPGYVYTEIEPRRWEVGATRNVTTTPIIRPMSTTQGTGSINTTAPDNTKQGSRNNPVRYKQK